jgi:hypothetical protein
MVFYSGGGTTPILSLSFTADVRKGVFSKVVNLPPTFNFDRLVSVGIMVDGGSELSAHTAFTSGVVGVLPTRATTENGPIRRGDLLVTSATPGHTMKGH